MSLQQSFAGTNQLPPIKGGASSLRQGQQVSASAAPHVSWDQNDPLDSWGQETPLDQESLQIANEALLHGGGAPIESQRTEPSIPGGGPIHSADISTLRAKFHQLDKDGDLYLNYDEMAALINDIWFT